LITDSAFIDILDPPVAAFSASVQQGCEPLTVVFTNNSQNAQSYLWDFGNGQTSNSSEPVSITYNANNANYIVTLIAQQGAQCTDLTSLTISVAICGCTDSLAINYNPSATLDDGSCLIPEPEIIVPNVFSPNSDDNNETFYLNTKNVTSLQLIILNRWGSVLYDVTSTDLVNNNPFWDGKINGEQANEGVYFYKYIAYGLNNQEVSGHGFLHLVDNQ
jgi:gliding motility-associated-like protein